MHDAGEKDTPPSDRLVVARKPLLPAPYARFYSSTRFRSVSRFSRARARLLSSPSKLFELWPQRHFGRASASGRPLEARSPYRSSDLRTLDRARSFIGNMFESSRAHSSIRSILELSSASLCFDPSLLVLSAEEKCRLWLYSGERFDQIFFFLFFFFERILIGNSIDLGYESLLSLTIRTVNKECVLLGRILFWISKESLERRVDGRFNACDRYWMKLKIWELNVV